MLEQKTDSDGNVALSEKKLLDNPSFFLNRELSWVRFNARVLEEARDRWHPLLERVKFIAICGSNLDEFFMTRIPRLMKKIKSGSNEKSMDGMSAIEQIEATRKEIIPLIKKSCRLLERGTSPSSCQRENLYLEISRVRRKRQGKLTQFPKTNHSSQN